MKKQAVVILVTVAVASGSARADSPGPPPPKSKAVAVSISLGATLIPVGIGVLMAANNKAPIVGGILIGSGALFGPSFGRVYAHDKKPFSMLPLRLAGAGLGLVGLTVAVVGALDEYDKDEVLIVLGLTGAVGGTVMYFTGNVIDVAKAPKAVDKYNQRAAGANWQLRPAYYAASHAVGAHLSISF